MNIGEKIKELRATQGLSQNQLAKKAGISQAGLSALENETKSPSVQTLNSIAKALGIRLAGLLDGDLEVDDDRERHYAPVLGRVAAGIPIEAVEDILGYEEISDKMASCGPHFALQIKGDSMHPRILENDVVIVRQQENIESGEVAVVLVNGNEATLKKVIKQDNGIVLVAYNREYPPSFYSNEDIQSLPVTILGKVVELRGKL